jgi:hypothetical protein
MLTVSIFFLSILRFPLACRGPYPVAIVRRPLQAELVLAAGVLSRVNLIYQRPQAGMTWGRELWRG